MNLSDDSQSYTIDNYLVVAYGLDAVGCKYLNGITWGCDVGLRLSVSSCACQMPNRSSA